MVSELVAVYKVDGDEGAGEDHAVAFLAACPAGPLELSSILSPRSVRRELPRGVTGALGIHFLAMLLLWTCPLLSPKVDIGNTAFVVRLVDLEPGVAEESGAAGQGVDERYDGQRGIETTPRSEGDSEANRVSEPSPRSVEWLQSGGPFPMPPESGGSEGRETVDAPTELAESERAESVDPGLPFIPSPPEAVQRRDLKEPEKLKPVQGERRTPQTLPGVRRGKKQREASAPKSASQTASHRVTGLNMATEAATASMESREEGGMGLGVSSADGPSGGRGGGPAHQEFQLAQVDTPPTIVSRVEPDYPAMARRQRLSGKVVIKFLVDPHGRVRNASVLQAAPQGVFESCVLDAVAKWRFKPGLYQGHPVATWVILPIQFKVSG